MTENKNKPNILFLVIDSLRADKCYENQRYCITPNLDKMIRGGTYFSQAISPSDATTLSIRSMFTGLLSFKTGTIKKDNLNSNSELKIPTIISVLKNLGYGIVGKVPSFVSLDSLYSAFDYNDRFSVEKQWPRLDDGMGLEIINKLKTNIQDPWFYYIHVLDVHSKIKPGMMPLIIPEKYDKEQFGKSKYERAISSMDYWLGKIMENINLENTIVIVTADHGSFIPHYQNKIKISLEESTVVAPPNIKIPKILNPLKRKMYTIIKNKSEENVLSKIKKLSLTEYDKRNLLCLYDKNPFRVLYDELIRVPLLFLGKDVPSGKIFTQQVSTRDIFPTITEILQLDENIKTDGRSLYSVIKGTGENEEEPLFIQSSFPMEKENGYLVGIRTSEYKYNRSIDNPTKNVFLYDLQKDPKEEENIANQQQNMVDKYEKILKKYLNQMKSQNIEHKTDEEKIIEDELKKLGYI
jgi:arylsulfatase A-like enzyme